jgi:hypothetical protein
MLHLMISHLIFLTRDERYALVNRGDVSVIGVNIPVWVTDKDCAEPAQEVFCRYLLSNHGENVRVTMTADGYLVNLPPQSGIPVPELTNDQWRVMTREQQDRWYAKYQAIPTAENLRDFLDNGSEYLKFRYISLTAEQKTIHNFEIKTLESLINSLT